MYVPGPRTVAQQPKAIGEAAGEDRGRQADGDAATEDRAANGDQHDAQDRDRPAQVCFTLLLYWEHE